MENEQPKFPTEVIELPSKGKLYPKESPLAKGEIEVKYMTAKEEDILTNQNYIQKGIVIDKLLQSLIVDKNIKYGSLIAGDKNAILVAARVLGYGSEYEFEYNGVKETFDLSTVDPKPLHSVIESADSNEFPFKLPSTGVTITFKLMNGDDEIRVDKEIAGLKKIYKEGVPELTTRLKHQILSVDGESDANVIREFVDNKLLAIDSRAFRKYVQEITPDVDLTFYPEDGSEGGVDIPIGINFLYPDL